MLGLVVVGVALVCAAAPAHGGGAVQLTLGSRSSGDVYDLYEYDARNRLTTACYDVGQSASSCSGATNAIGYGYDKVSNRLQETRSGTVGSTGTIDYSYNSADQLASTTRSGATTSYSYDANGNLAAKDSRSYAYDLADRLVSTSDGSTSTSYGYDGHGRRISADTGSSSTRFLWDPLAADGIPELVLERDSSGSLIRRYLNGPDGPLGFTTSAGSFSYHHDPLGSITDITDATGTPQWRYSYEPYGATLEATDVSGTAPDNPLRFTGQYLDPETGDYHLRARQYDPAVGRFDALDPVEPNPTQPYEAPYVYVDGQPTTVTDPTGEFGCGPFAGVCSSASKTYATVTGTLSEVPQTLGTYKAVFSDRGFWTYFAKQQLPNLSDNCLRDSFCVFAQYAKTVGLVLPAGRGTRLLGFLRRGSCAAKAGTEVAEEVATRQVTVLGRYVGGTERYLGEPGFNVLNAPARGTGRWNWTRNKRFIDDAIERGDELRLVTDPHKPLYSGGNDYQRELDYLRKRGYDFEQSGDYWIARPGR